MSKLRDMINAQQQKGKPSEQVVSGKIVQPETKPEEEKQPVAHIQQKQTGVLGRLRAKAGDSENKIETTQSVEPSVVEQPRPIVVEETMPSGLSLLAQMKWKREHAGIKISEIPTGRENVQSDKIQTGVGKLPDTVEAKSPGSGDAAGTGATLSESASRTADAQKTNDGVVDLEELKKNLAYLANNIENPALVGQVVRTIAQQIANSPQLCPHMTRGEVNLMVRGLRMSYQVAAMKKQEKVDSKAAKSKGTAELGQMFKDAGIDFAGLNLNLK